MAVCVSLDDDDDQDTVIALEVTCARTGVDAAESCNASSALPDIMQLAYAVPSSALRAPSPDGRRETRQHPIRRRSWPSVRCCLARAIASYVASSVQGAQHWPTGSPTSAAPSMSQHARRKLCHNRDSTPGAGDCHHIKPCCSNMVRRTSALAWRLLFPSRRFRRPRCNWRVQRLRCGMFQPTGCSIERGRRICTNLPVAACAAVCCSCLR
ncbi:hypothetical protein CFBP6600_07520 [Xanthomonas arboricola pv. corylina]|uniref:Uncharacterized protein n=1 Tax=Xanthomonas arboricola pv. corylina TaxID=487821 RepID=A0A8D6UM49_9XANT|nr:hypothetical protein CFBP1159_02710 [Xanthomonas arboricola pv. corylina]SUZ34895.1 hypothetical protein CPBF1521_07390 [Xanthomonas arboricola pv. juglandis]CAE6694947.1 hypothetical protein CFBP1159_02710 [Xanthomonas arboricola pv. corylina]CAE6713893.1 hypothetical protein XAC301_07500 [Xanthomonas arboricola pv. corylina]CAE6713917.1 hypothetical protein XAC301_07500 [Xanthomonas arboricola pv. corylina]